MLTEANRALIHRITQELQAGNLALLDAHPGLAELRPRIVQGIAAGHSISIEEIFVGGEWVATCTLFPDTSSEVLGMHRIVAGTIVR
jgi:hypothetical protein